MRSLTSAVLLLFPALVISLALIMTPYAVWGDDAAPYYVWVLSVIAFVWHLYALIPFYGHKILVASPNHEAFRDNLKTANWWNSFQLVLLLSSMFGNRFGYTFPASRDRWVDWLNTHRDQLMWDDSIGRHVEIPSARDPNEIDI